MYNWDYLARNFIKLIPCVVLLLLEIIDVSVCMTQAEINRHLELGKQYLAKGQLADALSEYHSAVEGDPNNYLTYFKRGTVYLALGKAKNALSDLDRVLEMKPDFTAARISRGSIHFKQANYDLAQLDFYNVLKVDPYNAEAGDLLRRIEPAKEARRLAEHLYGRDDYAAAAVHLSDAIDASPWCAELHDFRSEVRLRMGDERAAIADLRNANRLRSDDASGHLRLAQLLFDAGRASEALQAARECLKVDADHAEGFAFYKRAKRIDKLLAEAEAALDAGQLEGCIDAGHKVLKAEVDVEGIAYEARRLLCACLSRLERTDEAVSTCSQALERHQEPALFCDRADAYLQAELYDDAIRDYRAALDVDAHHDRAKEGLARAESRQKQSERRDYYKILEVKRSASKKEIVKAYRRMAQKWHPDNYQNDEKMKKVAEKKFIDIAAAKEVLTNEEKRKQFDNGEDPLDPESGRGGPNFNHFQSFHGSPFQFKFHFN